MLPSNYTTLPPVARRALLRTAATRGLDPARLWDDVLRLAAVDGLDVEATRR